METGNPEHRPAPKRSYKKELSRAEAFTIMEHEVKQGWWDPDLLEQIHHETNFLEKSPFPFLDW